MMIIPIYTSYLIYRTYQCCLAKKADKILPTIYNQIAVDMKGYNRKYSDLDGAIRHLGQDYSHSMIKLAYNQLIEDGKLTTYYTPEMYKFIRILYVGILVPLIIDYSINQYSSIDYVYIYNNLSINAANILNFTISSTSTAFFSARDKLYSAFEGIIDFSSLTFDYVSTTNTSIIHNYFNSINSYCREILDYVYNFTSYNVENIFLSTEKILKNISNSNLFQGITMSINIDDFITKTKDFTKPCYCVAVGTIGNIAKVGSIASHYYGLIFIHNKFVNKKVKMHHYRHAKVHQ